MAFDPGHRFGTPVRVLFVIVFHAQLFDASAGKLWSLCTNWARNYVKAAALLRLLF